MDTQSVHAVEYNDDLLIEILVRLPVVSLFLFKSVCKRWLSLISNQTFTLRRSQIPTLDPSYGLLIQRSCKYDFVSFDTRIPSKRSALKTTFPFGSEGGYVTILQSCNGLLLLCCCNTKFSLSNTKADTTKQASGDEQKKRVDICRPILSMVPQVFTKICSQPKNFSPTQFGTTISSHFVKIRFLVFKVFFIKNLTK